MLSRLQVFVFLIVLTNNVFSQEIVVLTDTVFSTRIGRQLEYFIDESKSLSYNTVTSDEFQGNFSLSNKEILFFNYQNATVWLKFTVSNQSSKDFYLLIDYPLLYKINLYTPTPNGIDTLYSGDGYPVSRRTIRNATNLFELDIQENETKTFFCSIESDGDVVSVPISVIDRFTFLDNNEQRMLFLGFYYGFLILIVLINIFFYFNIRDNAFLLYILFILSMGMFLFVRDGFAFKYFWPNSPVWANIAVVIFAMLTIGSVLLMIKDILQTKRISIFLDKLLTVTIIVIVSLTIPTLFSPFFYRFMIAFGNFLTAYSIVLILIIVGMGMKKGIYLSKYFLAALVFLQLGGLWIVMKNSGSTGLFEFEHGMKVCSVILILFLTYGMTVKFSDMLHQSKQQVISQLEEVNRYREDANQILENEVKMRTLELQKRYEDLKLLNHEISMQKEEILLQRDELQARNAKIELQSDHIISSIQYAKRIQDAVLPKSNGNSESILSHFVLFRPRDIVSGDFYWMKQIQRYIYVAASDCTGHGVPGGFMSMLGIAFLNDIIGQSVIMTPAQILNELREKVKKSLRQEGKDGEAKDGIDMALIMIDLENSALTYSGAFNPMVHIRKDSKTMKAKVKRFKGDCMPIGICKNERDFTDHTIQLLPNDMIYLYTDGYTDQLGGRERKKFMTTRFVELLTEIAHESPSAQKEQLSDSLNVWMGDNDQIDDILVIGVKFDETAF